MPRQWIARGLAILWMFASVVFIASYTAQLTTTLTVEQIRGAIEGPGDLPGKQVATITSSVAADYLREQNAQVQEFPGADQMFTALLDKKVDAVVAPAPLLLYYAAHGGKGRVKVVGPEFNRQPVAIEVQLDSPFQQEDPPCVGHSSRERHLSANLRQVVRRPLRRASLKGLQPLFVSLR